MSLWAEVFHGRQLCLAFGPALQVCSWYPRTVTEFSSFRGGGNPVNTLVPPSTPFHEYSISTRHFFMRSVAFSAVRSGFLKLGGMREPEDRSAPEARRKS